MPRPSHPILGYDEYAATLERLDRGDRHAPESASVLAASRLISDGRLVALGGRPPGPALPTIGAVSTEGSHPHALSHTTEAAGEWIAVNHRFEIDIHGASSMTHIDSLDHFRWRDHAPAGGDVLSLAHGTMTRGVLIDVPSLTGAPITPGDVITQDEVDRALATTGTVLQRGDALCIRFGRTGDRSAHADLSAPAAGLSIECLEWLADVAPSLVVTDGGLDAIPSEVESMQVPWHVALLTVFGIPLVDVAELDELALVCSELRRHAFALVCAPLAIPGSSGSPVNPLAVF